MHSHLPKQAKIIAGCRIQVGFDLFGGFALALGASKLNLRPDILAANVVLKQLQSDVSTT